MRKPLLSALLLGFALNAQTPPDPSMTPVQDDPALPRVLLIGDSISMGYTIPVRKLLEGKANVHRILTNGGPTSNGVGKIEDWVGGSRWNVIHFNFGLHDLKRMDDGKQQVPPDRYEENLRAIVKVLHATGAKLIWASTTPVPEGKVSPQRVPADVPIYNETATKVMKENGIPINDLYSFALERLAAIQRPVNVHFTDEGSAQLADRVASAIMKALGN
jgi:acyl-CoA thioesterase-1